MPTLSASWQGPLTWDQVVSWLAHSTRLPELAGDEDAAAVSAFIADHPLAGARELCAAYPWLDEIPWQLLDEDFLSWRVVSREHAGAPVNASSVYGFGGVWVAWEPGVEAAWFAGRQQCIAAASARAKDEIMGRIDLPLADFQHRALRHTRAGR